MGLVFARCEERRHSVDVRGERDGGLAKNGQKIVAALRGRHALDFPVTLGGQFAQVGEEIVRRWSFPAGSRIEIDERAREGEYIHKLQIFLGARRKGRKREIRTRLLPLDSAPSVHAPVWQAMT